MPKTIRNRKILLMLINACVRWRIRGTTATLVALLAGTALSVWSADAPASLGSAAPAEIPEPTSDVRAGKKVRKPKSPGPPPTAKAGERPMPAPEASAVKSQREPATTSLTSVAKSAEESKPVPESVAVKNQLGPDPDSQVPFVRSPQNNWYVSLSFDDYWFNAPIAEGTGGTQSGNLYGGSLSLASPSWQGRTYFDFSFRQGFLHGDTSYPPPYSSSLQTFINEVFAGFHFEVLPWMHDGKERGHVISYVGVSWDGWSATETLMSGHTWPATRSPNLTRDVNMVLGNVGFGYDLVLWNPTAKSFSYRLGVRAEAIGGVGGSSYNVQEGEQINSLALDGLVRGTAYMDLTLRNGVGVFIEGGYQQSWWFFSETPADNPGVDKFQGYWGAFGRVGVAFHF